MTYAEILISVIVIGIISISITVGVSSNNKSSKDIESLSKAVEIAQNVVKGDALGETQMPPEGYNISKDRLSYDELIKVEVNWQIANETKKYVLYATKPNLLYNK